MKKMNLSVLILVLFVLTTSAYAGRKNIFSFNVWVPNSWKLNKNKGVWILQEPHADLTLTMIEISKSRVKKTIKRYKAKLERSMRDVTYDDTIKAKQNSLDVSIIDGKGTRKSDGKKISFSIAAYKKSNKVLFVFGVTLTKLEKKHAKHVRKIIRSIK